MSRINDRRKLGVNFRSVLKAAKRLVENPEFEPTSLRNFAEAILEQIIGKNLPQAKESMPEIDWDALLEFIEKLLPIILMIIDLFS